MSRASDAAWRRPATLALAARRRAGAGPGVAAATSRGAVSAPPRNAQRLPGAWRKVARRLRRVEGWPPSAWLLLQALALWPVLAWAAKRFGDGSDEPLGLLALALLAGAALAGRLPCRGEARIGWLAAATALTLATTAAIGWLPWLALSMLAAAALACAWAALRSARTPVLPVLGLLLLALPVLASLQFYAGYPLRWLTAHGSAFLLQAAGVAAQAHGATIDVDGHLVIVDAPCSGVQLVWFGYCTACVTALWTGLRDTRFAARLPVVGLAVLIGNLLRNTVLVGLEGSHTTLPPGAHDAIGLVALAAVCGMVLWWMQRGDNHAR